MAVLFFYSKLRTCENHVLILKLFLVTSYLGLCIMTILSVALESMFQTPDSQDKTFELRGPLSNTIADALEDVYSKDNAQNDQINYALESAAIDDDLLNSNQQTDSEQPDLIIYGVNKTDIQPETLVEVKSLLDTKQPEQDVVVVVESPSQADVSDVTKTLYTALESLVDTYPNVHFETTHDASEYAERLVKQLH